MRTYLDVACNTGTVLSVPSSVQVDLANVIPSGQEEKLISDIKDLEQYALKESQELERGTEHGSARMCSECTVNMYSHKYICMTCTAVHAVCPFVSSEEVCFSPTKNSRGDLSVSIKRASNVMSHL